MAISVRCPVCKKDYRLRTVKCNCGNSLINNRLYKVRVRLPDGVWRSKQVNSLEMAKKVEAKFKTQIIEQKVFDIHRSPTLGQVWKKYQSWARKHKRSWKDDLQRWTKHIAPYIQHQKMHKVRPNDIQNVIDKMLEGRTPVKDTAYKPATIKQVLALLKRVFNWSIEQGLYHGGNPCSKVESPKFDNRVNHILSKDELRKLLAILDGWQNERASLVVRFALYSGKRKGEILRLRWNHVDFENRLVALEGMYTKNGASQILPLNESCMAVLKRAYELKISEYVFPSTNGSYYYNCFNDSWKRIRKKAGITIRFHDLRHTYASYLASSGDVDIYTLKELLGHKSLSMTQRYAHLVNGALRRGAEVADRVYENL